MEGLPKKEGLVPASADESVYGSEQRETISEQLSGLINYANLSPEELHKELESLVERIKALEDTNRTDELTGLLNRRGFEEEFGRLESFLARERSTRNIRTSSALLAIDLDGFKEVNDSVGHVAGDQVLKLIAQTVKTMLRESDTFARIGGDELSIYLPETNEEGAMEVARKVRGIIEEVVTKTAQREFPGYTGSLSASIGVLPLTGVEKMGVEDKMRLADYAMYVAKEAGKGSELTVAEAREIDVTGSMEKDFLAGKAPTR